MLQFEHSTDKSTDTSQLSDDSNREIWRVLFDKGQRFNVKIQGEHMWNDLYKGSVAASVQVSKH